MKTNQACLPIGFDTYRQAQAQEPIETATFVADAQKQENLYIVAIAKAMKEFVVEECCENNFSEVRLMKKIEAARTLFGDERKLLKTILR